MADGQIQWGMSFKVDKTGLNDLKTELLSIQKLTTADYARGKHSPASQLAQELKEIKQSATEVQTALEKSFNTNLGTLNVVKFNQELKKLNINKIATDFNKVGSSGQSAFRNLVTETLTTNLQLKETHKLLDSIATSMSNTIKWGITSNVFNTMAGSIEKAWSFSKSLDTSLNSIRIVTGKSADEMGKFAKQANRAAEELGRSTRDYTDASLIYYQQGLSDEETAARTNTTLKAANVTGQSGADVSEQLTAVWNGYKVSAEETELYVDKLAAVAASTASDLEELSTGISKVASAANTAGVDIDELTAQVATIISVTREAPETVGSALKTIYARLGDLQVDGVDEFGVSLGKVSSQLEAVGVQVLDESGNMRDMGDIITDLAAKWDTWTAGQKQAVAVAAAGKMQYTRLMTLMENWDMYKEALETSQNAMGTLQEQQDIYMESTEAHLQQLSTAWERVWIAMSDSKSTRNLIDVLTGLVTGMANFTEAVGGGGNALLLFGSVGAQVFSKQIAQGITTIINNFKTAKENVIQLNAQLEVMQQFKGININDEATQKLIEMKEQVLSLGSLVTSEQHNIANSMIQGTNELNNQEQEWRENLVAAEAYIKRVGDFNNVSLANTKKDSTGNVIKEYSDEKAYNQGHQQEIQALEDYQKELQKTTNEINNYKKILASTSKVQAEAIKNNTAETREKETQALQELESATENVKSEMAEFAADSRTATPQVKELLSAIKEFDKSYTNNPDAGLGDYPEALEKLLATYTNVTNQMKTEASSAANVISQEGNGASQRIQEAIRTAEQEYDKFINSIKTVQMVQQVTNLIGAFGQLASGIKTLTNIPTILNDEDLSTGEKALQIIMALGTAIPLITNAALTAGKALNVMMVANTGMGVSATIASGGVGALAAAIWSLAWPVLLVVAAIAALAAGIYALVKAYNADADAAKEAKKSVEELSTAYEEAKQKVEELKDAMSQYDEAKKSIEGLSTSTQEFKDELEKANEEARKLIDKYELFNNYSYDEKGLIKIDEKALEEALSNAEKSASRIRDSLLLSEMGSTQADLKSQRTNFARQVGTLTKSLDEKGLYLEGTTVKSGERIADSVQIDDKSVQAITNGLNEIKNEDQYRYENLFAKGNEETLKNTILAFEDITPAVRENIDQIIKQTDALKSLTDNTNNAAEKMGYISGEIIGGVVEDKYSKQFENFATKDGKTNQALAENLQNAMTTIIKNRESDKEDGLQKSIKEATEEAQKVKNTGDLQKYYPDVKNDVDLIRTYAAEIKGIDWDTINNHVTIKDQWGKGTMTTDEGKVLIENKNDEQMRRELAAKKAVDNIKKQYEDENRDFNDKLAESLENLATKASEFGAKYGTDFSSAMLASIANGTQEFDFSSLFDQIIDPDAVPEILNMSTSDLMAKMGLDEEAIKQQGFESAEQWASAFKAGFEGYEWDMDAALSAAMSKRDEEIDALGLTKKKTEAYKEEIEDYGAHLMRIAKDSDVFADSLDKDAESAVVAAQSIIEMNKGIDALADGFKDWSDVLKKSSKESQEYADALGGIQDALSLIYGVEADYISNDFVTSHLKEIEQAATGSETAIEGLRKELTEDIILKIAVYNGLNSSIQNDLLNMIHNLEAQIPDIKVGTEIDMDDETYASFLQTMQKIIDTAGLTADQANALFSTMGFDTNFQTEEQDIEQTSPNTVTETTVKGYTTGTAKGPDGEDRNWEYPILSTSTYQDGTSTHTGKMTVMAMATSADGTKVPQIKSVTKKGTGAQNNYSSKNKGGKSPGSSSGKKGKSGGSSKDPDKQDLVEDEKDPYHDIDIRIKQVSADLDKLDKQQSKFFGQKLINNLNKQWNLLNSQIDASREKINIARQEMQKLQGKLSGSGVSFNADGTIANYASAYNAQLNYVNSIINKYNSMSADSQESYKETVEQAKKDFEKFKSNIEEYDKTVTDIIPGLEADIQDAIDKQIQIKITEFNMEIEIRLDLAEAERDWNDFKRKVIDGIKDDDILGTTKARLQDFFSYYKNDDTGIIQTNTKHVNDILTQLRQIQNTGTSDWYGDNEAQALEDLKTYNDQLMSDLEDVEDLVQEIKDSYLDMMDEAADKLGNQVKMYEQIKDIIDHDMKVIELVYGEDSYEALAKYYQQQEKNYNQTLDFQKQQKDFWYNQMQQIEAAGGKNSEAWLKAKENWMDAVAEWNSTIESAIENLQDKYLNAINEIFDKLNDKITSGKGLDYVSEEWELINKNADQYLDTINSLYGIQDLEQKYLDAIDNTDSVSAQKKLNALMEDELTALREKDKLTEYDVERANRKYEIALKQIALEEAQQNKSTMRLRRDSQGNYSYQYVADNDEVGKISDELSQLNNDLYNFDLEHYRDNLDQIYSVWEEFQEKMADAAMINDPEERQERELLLREQYGELINGLVEQNETVRLNLHESAFTELAELYNTDLSNFTQLSADEQNVLLEQMIPQWESGVQHMADVFSGEGGFASVCKEAMNDLAKVTNDYQTDLNELENAAGVDFDSIRSGIDDTINKTEALISDNGELITSYQNELSAIGAVIQELQILVSQYNAARDAAIAATQAAYGYWQGTQRKNASAAKNNVSGSGSSGSSGSKSNSESNNGSSSSGRTSGSGDKSSNGEATVGNQITFSGSYYYDSFGTRPSGNEYAGVTDGVTIDIVNNNPYGIHIKSSDGKYSDLGWIKKSQVTRWNTGGYTGDWGDNSGRLAILDRKELVLNAEDTPNILNAVSIVREISGLMNNSIYEQLRSLKANQILNKDVPTQDNLEQQVHIDANFPGVKDSKEIENAFNNLVNIAAQRAYRKK